LPGWEAFLCWPSLGDYDDDVADVRDADSSVVSCRAKPATAAA
jgi:hypothetical protein